MIKQFSSSSVAQIPKVELHVHLEGTMRPSLVKQLCMRNKRDFPEDIVGPNETIVWKDFMDFIHVYDDVCSPSIRTTEDLRLVTYQYLKECHEQGVIYVELMLAVNLLQGFGISYQDSFKTVAEAIDQANRDFGIESRIILVLLRHRGPDICAKEVDEVLELNPRYLVGVGLAGDEANFPGHLFKEAYRLAEKAGLGKTAHSGEWSGPDFIRETIDALGVTRLGHGVLCYSDKKLMEELAKNKIHCEVCPGSNVSLGVFKSFKEHPLRIMFDAGISLSLNSDDPPYFGTTMLKEYQNAVDYFNFTIDDLLKVTRYGIEASFAEPALKAKLLERVNAFGGDCHGGPVKY